MRKLHNFKCKSCDKQQEHFVIDGITIVKCNCGGEATKLLAAPKYFGNGAGGKSPSC